MRGEVVGCQVRGERFEVRGKRKHMSDILKNTDAYTQPCFNLSNRMMRVLWNLIYIVLFRHSPVYFHEWRAFLLRCFGAGIGKKVHVYPKARVWAPWNLEMDDNSCFADDVKCYSMAKITIGKKAVVSQGVQLVTGTHDYTDPFFSLKTAPITVGEKAWIAAEAFVCPGVTVGEGAVVGARSVVTSDVPAWMVCAGNPCRPVKPRKLGEKG